MADEVAVMYAGEFLETGTAEDIFYNSAHPYTVGLRAAMPTNRDEAEQDLMPIDGSPPDLFAPPPGCAYFARCPSRHGGVQERSPAGVCGRLGTHDPLLAASRRLPADRVEDLHYAAAQPLEGRDA